MVFNAFIWRRSGIVADRPGGQWIAPGPLSSDCCGCNDPDDLAGIIADVPFVDVINTVSDPTIPLTVIEWEQWGNPANADEYAYMRAYSPYDNIEAKEYPHILAIAAWNDTRVQYWEPAKWVAKLRVSKTNNNKLFLKTNMGTGHGGSSGRFDYLKEVAFEYSFALDVMGLIAN